MKKIVLFMFIFLVLILSSCVSKHIVFIKNIDKAEEAGLVEKVEKTVCFEDFRYTVTKVYNDVTGYKIFYEQNELNESYKMKFILTDNLGNTYQTINGQNKKTSGIMGIGKIIDYSVKELYIDVVILEEISLSDGGYTEKVIDTRRINLPINFPPAYKNAIEIQKNYKIKVGNCHVEINRIAFGKTSTVIEYKSFPNYVKISKVLVDNVLYESVVSGGSSGSDEKWQCSASMDAIDNPKQMEIYLIDKSGNSGSIVIEIE